MPERTEILARLASVSRDALDPSPAALIRADRDSRSPDSISPEERAELDRRLEAYRRDPDAGALWAAVRARVFRR